MSWRQIWWVDIKCCQRWLWRHSGWVSGSPNLTCRLTKVDQGHQQPKHLISWISIILIQRKISVCSDTICWSSVEICRQNHLERGGDQWPVFDKRPNFGTYLPTEPPPVSLNTVGLNLKSRTQWSHSGHRTQWSHMASDGNPRGNKKVYGHREEGRSERKEEKTDPTLRQSSAPPGNEVLKGCFLKRPLKRQQDFILWWSLIKVGRVGRLLDPCFLPLVRSSLIWKQFNPLEISGGRITRTFCAHRLDPDPVSMQLTQKIRRFFS